MSDAGPPGSDSGAPGARRQKGGGAWAGYLIFSLILLWLIVVAAQAAYLREWPNFAGATLFTLAFLVVPTGGLKWLRRLVQARKSSRRPG